MGKALEGGVHPLEAVAQGKQVSGDGAEVVVLEEGVDLARVQRVGLGVERHLGDLEW
jgi:hypothetical protein